jgi:hypothetical protein
MRAALLTLTLAVVAATPAAAAWRPTVTLDPTPGLFGIPSPAFDPAGRLSVAFGVPGPAEVVSTKVAGGAFVSVNLGPPAHGELVAYPNGDLALFRIRSDGTNARLEVLERQLGGAFAPGEFLSLAGFDVNTFDVDTNAAGATVVVWGHASAGTQLIRARYRPAGGAWGPIEPLGDGPVSSTRAPRAEIGPDGTAAAIWAESGDNDHRFAVNASNPAGQFGSEEVFEYASGGQATGYDVAVLGGGGVIAAWFPHTGPAEFARRPPGASVFGTPEQLTEIPVASSIDAEPLPGEAVLVVWTDLVADVGVNAIELRGAERGPVQQLPGGATDVLGARLVTNTRGDALVAWADNNDAGDIHGSFRPVGQAFEAPEPLTPLAGSSAAPRFLALDDEGNGAVGIAYSEMASADATRVLAMYDPAGPRIADLQVPASGRSGTSVAVSAQAADVLGSTAYEWEFGDGGTATGTTAEHTYAAHGPHTVTLRAVDDLGNATTVERTIEVADGIAPTLTAALSKAKVRRGKRAELVATLGEAARLEVKVTRLLPGRRKGARCVPRRKRGKRCTARRPRGAVVQEAAAGETRVPLSPRFRGRRLKVGRYAIRVAATDAAGNAAPAQRLALRVRKPKRR